MAVINPGGGGGGGAFSQGTIAARPAASANALYFATDTGEWWIANAAGSAWASLQSTSAAFGFTAKPGASQVGLDTNGDLLGAGAIGLFLGAGTFGDTQLGRLAAGRFGANADLDVVTIGKGLRVAEGANAKQGVATLVAGTVTVANTSVTASSRILLTPQEGGALTGIVRVSARVAGTSFTISSTVGTDTAVVAWEIFEPG